MPPPFVPLIGVVPPSTELGRSNNLLLYIPPELIASFKEMVRRGLAFEHGESKALHLFAEQLGEIATPPMTPGVTKLL